MVDHGGHSSRINRRTNNIPMVRARNPGTAQKRQHRDVRSFAEVTTLSTLGTRGCSNVHKTGLWSATRVEVIGRIQLLLVRNQTLAQRSALRLQKLASSPAVRGLGASKRALRNIGSSAAGGGTSVRTSIRAVRSAPAISRTSVTTTSIGIHHFCARLSNIFFEFRGS